MEKGIQGSKLPGIVLLRQHPKNLLGQNVETKGYK